MGFKNGKEDSTICWDCANACTGGCSWAKDFTPVDGWLAEPWRTANGVDSYLVKECPEFTHEVREGRDWQKLDNEGCVNLVERVMEVARMDYIKCRPEELKRIEKFIRGKGASRLHGIQNPDQVIKVLQEQRKMYWSNKISMVKGGG